MAWVNVPASVSLVGEFNDIAPGRDKSSDGTVGDLAHQQSASDHNPDETGNTGGKEDSDSINEVHGRDVDMSGPWPSGWSMERFVQIVLARCRSGAEKRLDYIIYNRRIWSRSSGWVERDYEGSNPHDKHAHFSFRYGSGSGTSNPENITAPWGMLAAVQAGENFMAFIDNQGEFNSAMTAWAKSDAGHDALRMANVAALETKLKYVLTRVEDRGWSPLSVSGLLNYIFEALVAAAPYDANADGQAAESGSIQARLAYIEGLVEQILEANGPTS